MATERLSMRQIREILRQKWVLACSHRQVTASLRVSIGTVTAVLRRAAHAGLDWPQVEALPDDVLDTRLYGATVVPGAARPLPDCAYLHAKRTKPGVTLELLHLEYLEQHPGGYHYTQFCERYRQWLARHRLTMRQTHRAGEKAFVDYAGQQPHLVDPTTGEVTDVELFVGVLGASNYTYAEATATQQLPDWLASHTRMFAYFRAVPTAVVCDQLKSGVTLPCRYEPGLQKTYEEFAVHTGTTILPARPKKPRDKTKIEVAVQIAERWILARLRHETFGTLPALNARIWQLLDALNTRRMRHYQASRQELFERLGRPAGHCRPCPVSTACGSSRRPRSTTTSRSTATTTPSPTPSSGSGWTSVWRPEPWRSSPAASAWRRMSGVPSGGSTRRSRRTCPKPTSNTGSGPPPGSSPGARPSAPQTAALVTAILASRPHPEQGYRSCLGILRLARRDGPVRLEAACARALAAGARSYRHVDAILKHGLDRVPLPAAAPPARPVVHAQVRGATYYQ